MNSPSQSWTAKGLQPDHELGVGRESVRLNPGLSYSKGMALSELATSAPGLFTPYGPDTTLNGALAAAATNLVVNSVAGFFPGESIVVNGENHVIAANGVNAGTKTITITVGLTGAAANAAAVAHGDAGVKSPQLLMEMDATTDANGLITFGTVSTGEELSQKHLTAPAYSKGDFRIEDLFLASVNVGASGAVDAAAVTSMGKIKVGSLAAASGILRLV